VGFNANRRYRDSKWRDIGLLIAFILVIVPALLWGFGIIG
jgi:hypothetical protein